MANIVIPINSVTKFSHDWSFFEKIGFSKIGDCLILPDGWQIFSESFKPHRLKTIKPIGCYNRWGAIWYTSGGFAQNVVLTTRYHVRCQYRNQKYVFVSVYDKKMDIPLFITKMCKKGSKEAKENIKKCNDFLKLNYPDYKDPTAYWLD